MSISNFKGWPKGFLLALLLITLFEGTILAFENVFYNYRSNGLRMKIKNDISLQKHADLGVLILGDCFAMTGIVPSIIESETGLTAFNTSVHMPHTIYALFAMFDNYFERDRKKPEAVVLGFLPRFSNETKEKIIKENLQFFYDFRKGNIGFFIKEFGWLRSLPYLIPSLSHQDFIKQMKSFPKKERLQAFIDKIIDNKGGLPDESRGVYTATRDPADYRRIQVSPCFKDKITEIVRRAEEGGAGVVFVIAPRPPDYFALDQKSGFSEGYNQFVYSLKDTFENVVVLNPQEIINGFDSFESTDHLNHKGAQMMSRLIAQEIIQLKAGLKK